jgi:hypothetical protein
MRAAEDQIDRILAVGDANESRMRSLALTHAALILCLIARFRPTAIPPSVIAL